MGIVRQVLGRAAKRAARHAFDRWAASKEATRPPAPVVEPSPEPEPEPVAADAPTPPLVQIGKAPIVEDPPAEATERRSPTGRRILSAPDLIEKEQRTGALRIKAQPLDPESCRFLLSRPLLPERSWRFERTDAAGLAEALFDAIPALSAVLIDDSTLLLTRTPSREDWRPTAERAGEAIRRYLYSEAPVVPDTLVERIPDESIIRARIQKVLDDEVNPGVAAHSGFIQLTRVRGNSVYISMGGGCQGCSAADITLKDGIHRLFREAVPEIGAIYDETDHAAGLNPYFT